MVGAEFYRRRAQAQRQKPVKDFLQTFFGKTIRGGWGKINAAARKEGLAEEKEEARALDAMSQIQKIMAPQTKEEEDDWDESKFAEEADRRGKLLDAAETALGSDMTLTTEQIKTLVIYDPEMQYTVQIYKDLKKNNKSIPGWKCLKDARDIFSGREEEVITRDLLHVDGALPQVGQDPGSRRGRIPRSS